MGVSNSGEIFQDKVNEMFWGFELIHVYINYILVLVVSDCKDCLEKIELITNKIK